jgi:hypothetical protein
MHPGVRPSPTCMESLLAAAGAQAADMTPSELAAMLVGLAALRYRPSEDWLLAIADQVQHGRALAHHHPLDGNLQA